VISNKEIKNFIMDKILADAPIDHFCVANFNRSLLVMSGINEAKPPEAEDYPVFLIDPIDKTIGESNSNFTHQILCHLVITGDTEPLVVGNRIEHTGTDVLEELGDLIIDCLKKNIDAYSNLEMFDISFFHNPINAFPHYSGAIEINFEVPNIIGCNKITFN